MIFYCHYWFVSIMSIISEYTNLKKLVIYSLRNKDGNSSPFTKFIKGHRWYDPRILLRLRPFIYPGLQQLFVWACYQGDLIIADKIRCKGDENKVEIIHAYNDFSLQLACRQGHLHTVKYLVENGADINVENTTSLQYASEQGHLDIVKYLIEKEADIHAAGNLSLLLAADQGHLDIMKYLIENGADINANNGYPLRWAAANGHMEMVKFLVEKGADISVFVLEWAVKQGHSDIIKFLKAHHQSQIEKKK